jgi:hypothetical protein
MPAITRSPSPPLARLPQGSEWLDRIAAPWRFLRDVLAEAQAMRREASRKYPFVDN